MAVDVGGWRAAHRTRAPPATTCCGPTPRPGLLVDSRLSSACLAHRRDSDASVWAGEFDASVDAVVFGESPATNEAALHANPNERLALQFQARGPPAWSAARRRRHARGGRGGCRR